MNRSEFSQLVDQTVSSCKGLLNLKGGEYASDVDVLANFKRGAANNGVTPGQVALVFLGKHLDAIHTYVRNDAKGAHQILSEPIEGRFHDAINYLFLLLAVLEEGKGLRLGERPREDRESLGKHIAGRL